jgi:hypothetical protein
MITFTLETITPETASRLLKEHDDAVQRRQIVNRPRHPSSIARYAADIIANRWFPETAETLKFEGDSKELHGARLIDGQNRLAAGERAGRSFQVYVARGIERRAQTYIDGGDKRSLKDKLFMAGELRSGILAPALRWLGRWDEEERRVRMSTIITDGAAMALLEVDPAIRHSAQYVEATPLTLLGFGLGAFLHRIFCKVDEGLSNRFIDSIATGANLSEADPFWKLREYLIENKTGRHKLHQNDLVVLSFKAFNAAYTGHVIKKLSLKRGEECPALVRPAASEAA